MKMQKKSVKSEIISNYQFSANLATVVSLRE